MKDLMEKIRVLFEERLGEGKAYRTDEIIKIFNEVQTEVLAEALDSMLKQQ